MDFLNTWQFNLVAFLIAIVFFFQFNRLAVKNAKDNAAATLFLQGIATATSALLIPFFPITFPLQLWLYGFMIAACIFYAFNDRLQTPIRKHLPVSTFSIIYQLMFVFTFVYGLIIFREPLVLDKVLGILLIIAGNIILLYKKGSLQVNRYVIFAVLSALALSTAITIDIGTSKHFNLPLYIFLTLLLPGLMIMLNEKVSYRRVVTEAKQSSIKTYCIAGVAWALAIFFSLRALQTGEVTTVVPLQSLSVLLNIIVAYLFLKERKHFIKKALAACVVVVGIIVLTAG